MADESNFGGQPEGAFGSGFSSLIGGEPQAGATIGAEVPPAASPPVSSGGFGSGLAKALGAPQYRAPDPELSPLDQTADTLQQRIKRANDIAANPMLQFFSPEGVQKARDFVPAAAEKLQQIRTQQAAIRAGRQEAESLGLAPGEAPDEATTADRVKIAQAKALKGDLRVWKGLQAVDPKAAEAIADQVSEVAAGHLTKAQYAFDSLAGMQNQGQYNAKLAQLRKEGSLSDLEALGLKIPPSYEAFQSSRAIEGKALRDARIGIDGIRQKLEERNTYQPMEEKEAKTYNGRLTTAFGDQITNGTWGRNAAAGTRGLIVNGAADPRDLGKKFTLATPDQRKAIGEEATQAVPKAELEKARAFDRTYELAAPTEEQKKRGDKINTNPNVQQAIAEQLASMLRGGTGGANVGLLNIETSKRGYVQSLLDKITAGYAGGLGAITGKDVRAYMTKLTQDQIREVMDGIKEHNDELLNDRLAPIAKRAGALGLDTSALGWGKDEAAGVIGEAVKAGREEQIARMTPFHQAIGGGDGVFQLGAQRPGAGATSAPPGTESTTQLPGALPIATPVQQSAAPQPGGSPSSPGGGAVPPGGSTAPTYPMGGPGAPGGGSAPAPVTIAGQSVNVPLPPGASPAYATAAQRIESGNEKSPWTAEARGNDGKLLSSASGAFQMTDSTWAENKPAGATAKRAKDATPAEQSQAFATLTAKNGTALQRAGIPVNDASLYVAHNLGATGAQKLLTADPNASAREIVGEAAARNNPMFFRGRPTVAMVLERYGKEMEKGLQTTPDEGPKPKPGAGGATAEAPGVLSRARAVLDKYLMAGVAGGEAEKRAASQEVIDAGVEHAPAIGGTLGAAAGSVAGPGGTMAGGAAGGGAGQALKDYLQGRGFNPKDVGKEMALGGVLGVAAPGRPIISAAVRATGAGAVEAGNAAIEGKDAADVIDAGMKGTGLAAGGELFGRALGMAGHKVWSMFAPNAKKAVQEAAGKYAAAEETLAKEVPTLPGVGGQAGGKNPAYLKAEADKLEAERVLKDAGLKPEEAAYAHKVAAEGVPKQEAEVARPGELEKKDVGAGYQKLENEVAGAGVGAPKAAPKLPDGPLSLVSAKKVSADHRELAEQVEMAVTAPAKDWREKWTQLAAERSKLLQLERDALSSTATGKTRIASDMRTLADSVRTQQEKAAKYVFGEKDGEAFMQRLKTLDVRYRNLMEATNGGDLAKAAALKGEAGRDADRKFRAFAHDDPQAIAAWEAMRRGGSNVENDVRTLVGMEKVPYIGSVVTWAKMAGRLREWAQEREAGMPVRFADFIKTGLNDAAVGQTTRDVLGSAGARAAAM